VLRLPIHILNPEVLISGAASLIEKWARGKEKVSGIEGQFVGEPDQIPINRMHLFK
jgi:hypothetical protein